MHPEINIWGRSIPVYGIMFYAGIAAASAVAFIKIGAMRDKLA